MCETTKDFERLEVERWEEASLVCPARLKKNCGLFDWILRECSFKNCFGRFCALHFGPRW